MLRAFGLLVFLAAACCWPAPAQTTWQTVTSKEGQFTVELPAKPTINKTQTRKGSSGTTRFVDQSNSDRLAGYDFVDPTGWALIGMDIHRILL